MILTSQSEPRAVHSLWSRLRAPRCGCGESRVGMASPRAEGSPRAYRVHLTAAEMAREGTPDSR